VITDHACKHLVNVINWPRLKMSKITINRVLTVRIASIWLMLSVSLWPKVITLSGFKCILLSINVVFNQCLNLKSHFWYYDLVTVFQIVFECWMAEMSHTFKNSFFSRIPTLNVLQMLIIWLDFCLMLTQKIQNSDKQHPYGFVVDFSIYI
jgi:hypothetical protein